MSGLFSKKSEWKKPFDEKIAKRVSRIPTGELSLWSEQALSEIGRSMSAYERTREPVYLAEALDGAEVLHAIIDEYSKRMTSTT